MVQKVHPLVSIITACYNDGKYISETINSIFNSEYHNIEHIIVDDGSNDQGTLKVLRQQKESRVFFNTRQGVIQARNYGVNVAQGEYILFLDADDLISPAYVMNCVEALEKSETIKAVTTNFRYFGDGKGEVKVPSYNIQLLIARNLFIITTMFRRRDFLRVGGFSENMASGLEDWDFWLKILGAGGEVLILSDVNFYYRIKKKGSSRNLSIADKRLRELRRTIWENHRHLYNRHFLDPMETFEYVNIKNSAEYKIGTLVMSVLGPFRRVLKRFKF